MTRAASQQIQVDFLVEADKHGFSFANGRCPQVAGGAEHVRQQRLIIRVVLLHREGDDLGALRDHDFGRGARHPQRVVRAELRLGVDNLFCLDVMLRKEPLRFGA